MKTVFVFVFAVVTTAVFPANVRVLKTDGEDLYPTMFRIGSGSMFVIWETVKYPPDYDVIYAKYLNGKWIEHQRGNWPYGSPYVNHHHPALAIRADDQLCAFAQGAFPPTDTIGDNFFWASSSDTGFNWSITWIIESEWFKDCSNLTAAAEGSEMFTIFQDNQEPDNPNIRGWYFLDSEISLVDFAVESYPEANPFITSSSSGFAVAFESKPASTWDILDFRPSGTLPGSPIEIAADPAADEVHPYCAASGDYYYCAYRKGNDVYLAYSVDGGWTYQSVPVATSPQKEDWPAVACNGATVDIAYFHESGNIIHRRSTNNGVTWSTPDTVTTQPSAQDKPRITMLYDNPCHIIWVDGRDGSANLYYGRATLGIGETEPVAMPELKISPNPFATRTVIEYSTGTIELYNALGRLVLKSSESGRVVFDGSDLPAGIYFVTVKNKTGSKTAKAILLK